MGSQVTKLLHCLGAKAAGAVRMYPDGNKQIRSLLGQRQCPAILRQIDPRNDNTANTGGTCALQYICAIRVKLLEIYVTM